MPEDDAPWRKKQIEYEEKKARAKALRLRLTCTICGARPKTLLNCPCGTTQYCSVDCQRIDWRDRGHRAACKKIRNERAAEAARAEAPTPPPSPPVYGPAPRSHADEVRARIAAEHEAARARREANPEREPTSERWGSRCPICFEDWDVNESYVLRVCCCRRVCKLCMEKMMNQTCPLCRAPPYTSDAEYLVHVRRHVQNEVPEAIYTLGKIYQEGALGISEKSSKKAVKLLKRAVELGCVEAMNALGLLYQRGEGVKKIDSKKSMQLYEMAADQGSHWGQHNLASLLYEEEIKKASPNHAEVFRYYKLAADQGLTEAEINLGMCYVHGYGVSADMNEARRWFVRAAAKGHEKAIFVLEELDRRLG